MSGCVKCNKELHVDAGDKAICMECLPDDLYDLYTEALEAFDGNDGDVWVTLSEDA